MLLRCNLGNNHLYLRKLRFYENYKVELFKDARLTRLLLRTVNSWYGSLRAMNLEEIKLRLFLCVVWGWCQGQTAYFQTFFLNILLMNELLILRKSLWKQDHWREGKVLLQLLCWDTDWDALCLKSQVCRTRRGDFKFSISTPYGCGNISCWLKMWTLQSWQLRLRTSVVLN